MAPLADVLTVLGVVLVTAMVGGPVGLFVIQSATDADGHPVIAGFAPTSILLAGGTLVAIAASATVGVSMAVALFVFTPANILGLAVAGLLTALIYGLVGVVVGTQVDRLAGVWILLFAPLFDVVLFQNPLATETKTLAILLPSYATMRLAVDAGFGSSFAWIILGGTIKCLTVVAIISTITYYRST